VLAQRRQNRGFEGVAYQDGKVYAFVQSPIRNLENLSNGVLNGLQNIRIVEFDPTTQTTRQFLYQLDNPPSVNDTDTRADKIGDAVAIGNGEFLVIERDDDAIDSDSLNQIQKKVYRFSLGDATDISALSGAIDVGGGVLKTVDQMTTRRSGYRRL
jgi:2',3'-cyclic-nucleotide 2'-phosphodiesterase / 3'-nucleotidase / 5'-nucleotidase